MASLVLTVAGEALGPTLFGATAFSLFGQAVTGAALGGVIGGVIGSVVDASLFGPGTQKQQGPRLDSLQVQASTEGAAIPEIAGRNRIAGQIIWATNFKEVAQTQSSGGKGGGGSVQTTTYTYYANVAIGLCEGVIDRIGRVWADGNPLDMSGITMRVHRGEADQDPDSLIEGIEGTGNAPAYRGTAYVVFENLQITQFGNRIPQFTFEVFRRVSRSDGSSLEDIVRAITVIPGAGERVYDPVVQTRSDGDSDTPENEFSGQSTADWNVSLDDLGASLPNVGTVFLVVGWFGDDLRAGHCTIRPKVEVSVKTTKPDQWQVHTLGRSDALVVSQIDGRPAYGGTPSDDSVVRAIRDLKARGYSVVFYPFIFMDVPDGNTLPDPWTGGTGQPVYPWRGRITCDPAPGQSGTVDKTSAATSQIGSFFGSAAASNISVSVNATTSEVTTTYSGPDEWSFRRFILHYAKLCAAINSVDAGAVDGFLIGSELRGITQVRDSATNFPAVAKLATLAADVKGIVGSGVKVGYAADWSEYNNYNPGDGTGDLFFHLDPLWSDSHVDFVGIDNYMPLSDWRDGNAHLDAAVASSIYDLDYLKSNIEGGEDYDWYYASQADRDSQTRTSITDGTGKPWVYRAKDVRNWWLNQHFNRPGGTESGSATAWVPQSKPIWFTEFGIPSVDKGTNEPNVFYDPKSSESFFPYYSTGTRDDLIQRRGIEAVLSYWGANNPTSSVYGAPMLATIAIWTWDARPYPAWPARTDVWGDGGQWPYGHWLNGKIGLADLAALVAERCERVGFTGYDVSELAGVVTGYVRDRPMSPRSEIETLMSAFAFDAAETNGVVKFVPRGQAPVATFGPDDCVMPDQPGDLITVVRAQEIDLPEKVSVTFVDSANDYQSGTVQASRVAGYSDRSTDVTVPLVMDQTQAQLIADRTLAEAWIGRETAQCTLPPGEVALDACDVINLTIGGQDRQFRVTRITDTWSRAIEAQRCEAAIYAPPLPGSAIPSFKPPPVYGAAILELMDLPLLHDADPGFAPYVGASSSPFAGVTVMDSPTGDSYAVDTVLPVRAVMGETVFDFWSGPTDYFDLVNTLRVKLYSGALASVSEDTLLSGRSNAVAIKNADGDWEILQFRDATLVSTGVYDLTVLLRGRLGTEHAMRSPVASAARVVVLDASIAQIQAALSERGVTRFYKWGPSSLDPADNAWQQETFTARCVGLMPWSPVHVAGSRNSAGDLSISWVRRTRFGGEWNDGTDVPLNEESERYEVDVLNGASVVRTISATSPSATYTAAQQTADFGSAQSSVSINVYQISATVGRGWPAAATL